MKIQVPVSVCGFSVYCDCNMSPLGFGEGVQEGDAPPPHWAALWWILCGGQWSLSIGAFLSQLPLGMMLKTSSTYLFQSLTGTGNSGPNARSQNTPCICWQLLESRGEPIVALCSCLKEFVLEGAKHSSPRLIWGVVWPHPFQGPMVLHLKEQPYLCLASGSSICSVNSLLMMSKAVGTGMLVNRADTSKETSSSSPLILTDLRWSLKLLLSLTKDGVIPVYLWRILVRI